MDAPRVGGADEPVAARVAEQHRVEGAEQARAACARAARRVAERDEAAAVLDEHRRDVREPRPRVAQGQARPGGEVGGGRRPVGGQVAPREQRERGVAGAGPAPGGPT